MTTIATELLNNFFNNNDIIAKHYVEIYNNFVEDEMSKITHNELKSIIDDNLRNILVRKLFSLSHNEIITPSKL